MQPRVRLENRTGYDTSDLRKIVLRGMRAYGVPSLDVLFVTAPSRHKGCADVGYGQGGRAVFALAPPSRFSMSRFAKLFRHEAFHRKGYRHADMRPDLLYSTGPTPRWIQGAKLRYRGRAPDQMPRLEGGSRSPS